MLFDILHSVSYYCYGEELPAWFFVLFGAALAIAIEKKFFHHQVSETALAIKEMEQIRADPSAVLKHVQYSGDKNVPISANEFRRWMRIVTEFTIDYYEHPEVYDVKTGKL